MGSILNEEDRAVICRRVGALTDSSTARWGRMDVGGMLAHLCLSAQMGLGDLPVASVNKRLFQVFPVKHLLLYVLPFPKGAPTARELLASSMPSTSLEEGRSMLLALLERIGTGPRDGDGPAHPLFGALSWQEWGVLMHKHADHHLSQFGA